jgi:aminoglycoside 3'-phosphotransferase-1
VIAEPPVLTVLIAGSAVEPVLAGEAGATVLRLTVPDGGIRYIKYGSGDVASDIADEAHRLAWLQGRVACAEPIQFVRSRDEAWLLTGAVAGRTGDEWIEGDPALLPMVIDAYARFLRQLHALPIDDCPFDAGAAIRLAAAHRRVIAGVVDVEDFDDDHEGLSADQLWAELMRLRPAASERVVTHGDFSLGNVLIDEVGRVTGCIDVGGLGVADPYQDIAILWQNLREFGEEYAARFIAAYGIETLDRRRLDFHCCLDEMF